MLLLKYFILFKLNKYKVFYNNIYSNFCFCRSKRTFSKFKKFKKAKILYEYALIFNTSDDMIEYVCAANLRSIKKSSLYTEGGAYQLIITSYRNISKNQKCGVFFDKPHIDQIKQNSQLICDDNAILKLQKAFKAT